MKLDALGLNHSLLFSATCQTVRPRSSALSSGHFKIAPPHASSANPRWRAYQAASCLGSDVDLKNTPPIPVILAMGRTMPGAGLTDKLTSALRPRVPADGARSVRLDLELLIDGAVAVPDPQPRAVRGVAGQHVHAAVGGDVLEGEAARVRIGGDRPGLIGAAVAVLNLEQR